MNKQHLAANNIRQANKERWALFFFVCLYADYHAHTLSAAVLAKGFSTFFFFSFYYFTSESSNEALKLSLVLQTVHESLEFVVSAFFAFN